MQSRSLLDLEVMYSIVSLRSTEWMEVSGLVCDGWMGIALELNSVHSTVNNLDGRLGWQRKANFSSGEYHRPVGVIA